MVPRCVGSDGVVLILLGLEVVGWMGQLHSSIHQSIFSAPMFCSRNLADVPPLSISFYVADGAVLRWWCPTFFSRKFPSLEEFIDIAGCWWLLTTCGNVDSRSRAIVTQ